MGNKLTSFYETGVDDDGTRPDPPTQSPEPSVSEANSDAVTEDANAEEKVVFPRGEQASKALRTDYHFKSQEQFSEFFMPISPAQVEEALLNHWRDKGVPNHVDSGEIQKVPQYFWIIAFLVDEGLSGDELVFALEAFIGGLRPPETFNDAHLTLSQSGVLLAHELFKKV
jgi:hypothetical protein